MTCPRTLRDLIIVGYSLDMLEVIERPLDAEEESVMSISTKKLALAVYIGVTNRYNYPQLIEQKKEYFGNIYFRFLCVFVFHLWKSLIRLNRIYLSF